jgi:TctA family transporter
MAKPSVALLSVYKRILPPSIMPICVLGAAAQNDVAEIYVMLIFGVIGIGPVGRRLSVGSDRNGPDLRPAL